LQLAYWNENLSIRLSPVAGFGSDGVRQYNFNARATTAITVDKSIALVKKIDEIIMPAIENAKASGKLDKPVNTGLTVGAKGSAIFVELKEDKDKVPTVFLTIYTNINAENNTAPSDGVFSYPFAKTQIVTGYDSETGAATTDTVESEFEFFVEKLRELPKISSNVSHAINLDNAYKAMYRSAYQNRNGNGGDGSNGNNGNGSGYNAPMQSVDSDDFGFLS
jgi:hypothetical protein